MVTSTALVALPATTLTSAAAVPIADSDSVLAGALPGLSSGTSLATLRNEVQVTSPRPNVLLVSARAGTAAQAEATANAVAESYIGYAGSAGNPAGHMPAVMLQPAMSRSGAAGLMRLLVGAMLGVASGVLTGVIAALAYRRLILTRGPVPGDLVPSR
jgi:capsular polysaccharide biosynthesis protein